MKSLDQKTLHPRARVQSVDLRGDGAPAFRRASVRTAKAKKPVDLSVGQQHVGERSPGGLAKRACEVQLEAHEIRIDRWT